MRYNATKMLAALILTVALTGCVDSGGYSLSYGANYAPGYPHNPGYFSNPGYGYPSPVYAAPPLFNFGLGGFSDRDDEDDD